jgi:uncharacterized membrane protein YkvA (DUF1232 family)
LRLVRRTHSIIDSHGLVDSRVRLSWPRIPRRVRGERLLQPFAQRAGGSGVRVMTLPGVAGLPLPSRSYGHGREGLRRVADDPALGWLGMSWLMWFLAGIAALVAVWALVVVALLLVGRRTDARALAGFIPDCLVLMRRLLADSRVPRSRKCLLVGLVGYLALPFDLVPDFIPIAGQLDDVIVVGLVLRAVVRTDGGELVREHWPGPKRSLELVLRAAGVGL